jgi:hypothetical protein
MNPIAIGFFYGMLFMRILYFYTHQEEYEIREEAYKIGHEDRLAER